MDNTALPGILSRDNGLEAALFDFDGTLLLGDKVVLYKILGYVAEQLGVSVIESGANANSITEAEIEALDQVMIFH
ncbi:MAG: hypothetical protein ABIG95_00530 [Candidatus Woesearchaeota archaeon]